MTPKEKIKEAKKLLWEATKELKAIETKKELNEVCECGHKRKYHSVSHSINYTGGVCSKCKCLNFLEAPKKNLITAQTAEPKLKNGKLPIPHVRASALIKRFSEWNNKYPKGRIYSINSKDGMEMIRELDELVDEAQELNKHLP